MSTPEPFPLQPAVLEWLQQSKYDPQNCNCLTCDKERQEQEQGHYWPMRMHLCPTCKNKRCPHATHHDRACTGSNAPGQPGSDYQ